MSGTNPIPRFENASQGSSGAMALAPREQVSLTAYIDGLRTCLAERESTPSVHAYLNRHTLVLPVLRAAMRWQPACYTRNTLHRNEQFEIVVVCWDFGAVTPIHDHGGQRCWSCLVKGALRVENFELLNPQQKRRTGAGVWATQVGDKQLRAGEVDYRGRGNALHRVSNPPPWGERAVSVQIYARPMRSYVVYDAVTGVATRYRI